MKRSKGNEDFKERKTSYYSNAIQEVFHKMTIQGKYKIIGSGAIQGILYGADVDLSGTVEEAKDSNVVREDILKKFQDIFKRELKERNYYITDLKCGIDKEGNALRWNKETIKSGFQVGKDGEVYKFTQHIMDKAIFKLDFVVFINGLFLEFSENYYITMGDEMNFDESKAKPEAIAESLMKESRELYKEGKYLKSVKRLFASLRQVGENPDGMQERILHIINSQVGLLNKCKADLETISIMLSQTFKKVPINTIRQSLQTIKQNFMTIGEIDFRGEECAKEIDALCKPNVIKKQMNTAITKMAEYFGDVANSTIKNGKDGFLDYKGNKDIDKIISGAKGKKAK